MLAQKNMRFFSASAFNYKPFNTVFFGTDQFSITCLSGLLRNRNELLKNLLVVTPPDNQFAKKHQLKEGMNPN